ncbi:hypothetical protein [Sphingomonas sp. Y38-1Y]|uniref:hypothetical protein n=1 Tax=Sphingomonas sp. Y38-1Y TaxID=3078265 RepID=UPI0028E3A1BD|nr:hypothetical protein [Sphingomonas sp. Y38-1Y]
MSVPNDEAARARAAKGAAREAIGKLIGDDAEVRKGRDEREATAPSQKKRK